MIADQKMEVEDDLLADVALTMMVMMRGDQQKVNLVLADRHHRHLPPSPPPTHRRHRCHHRHRSTTLLRRGPRSMEGRGKLALLASPAAPHTTAAAATAHP